MSWEKNNEGYSVYIGNLPVRGGSYGDPAAVPFEVWEALLSKVKNWTMYTHQWRTCDQRLKKFSMASVDSPEERAEAQALGWRTFMVVPEGAPVMKMLRFSFKDILCPATDYPRRGKVCASCEGSGVENTDTSKPIGNCPECESSGRVPTTCAVCGLCRGTTANAPSIFEIVHGPNKENHKW